MGRTSKRQSAGKGSDTPASAAKNQKSRQYKAGIYARLSADIDKKVCRQTSKNESVEVQIEIARKFIEEWNGKHTDKIEVVDCYIDLGKTGTNFNRGAFQRLMQDVRMGDINCVIVKDLSRFGRNYLEAGNYIEKIFPFLGVRFIAVADGFDTGAGGNETKQMVSEIKNLVNDMYAKDFSVKAKASLAQRRKEGSYVGGPAPYGYKAVWEGKVRRLIPDENTEEIVRYIFQKFIETESYTAVADDLNTRKINPPAVYHKTGEVYCPPDAAYKGWDKSGVERIIKSDTYAGKLVQGKTSITARDENNRIHKPEDDWVVKEEAHEPLITPEIGKEAAGVRKKLREQTKSHAHPTEGCPIGENIFDKVLYCGVCGRKMTRHSYVKHYAAAVFLLSADENLWEKVSKQVLDTGIYFDRIRLGSVTLEQYILFHAARDVYLGTKHIRLSELTDRELIPDEILRLIVNAFVMERYGVDIVEREVWNED